MFTHLGIEADAFFSADEYAIWLGYRSGGMDKMSNLMEIVYAVAALKDQGSFPETSEFAVSSHSTLVAIATHDQMDQIPQDD